MKVFLYLVVSLNPKSKSAFLQHFLSRQWSATSPISDQHLLPWMILGRRIRNRRRSNQVDVPHAQNSPVSTNRLRNSRSTCNPEYEGGLQGNTLAAGRDQRRARLHNELAKIGIDPDEIESKPENFGTAAIRSYNSFIFPKSAGALAVVESSTRAKVVAINISFLTREHKADHESWLRNIDSKLITRINDTKSKHPIIIILDNVRSAHNVGNILRLAEAAQVDSVRLCGITPQPPHPKVLKTAMGAAELVYLGDNDSNAPVSTLQTVLDLKSKGVKVYGVETTDNSTTLWDVSMPVDQTIAYVFGNELIGVDVDVLRECDLVVSLPTYGIKNSLNVANCVSVVLWETLRQRSLVSQK